MHPIPNSMYSSAPHKLPKPHCHLNTRSHRSPKISLHGPGISRCSPYPQPDLRSQFHGTATSSWEFRTQRPKPQFSLTRVPIYAVLSPSSRKAALVPLHWKYRMPNEDTPGPRSQTYGPATSRLGSDLDSELMLCLCYLGDTPIRCEIVRGGE